MLFLILSLALRWVIVTAADPATSDPSSPDGCTSEDNNNRLAVEIVWSCVAIIFACTWVSVHPNVPALDESSWEIMKRRLYIMLAALLAPEAALSWALRQWIGARAIASRYKQKGWTTTHGFFLIMGGFVLEDSEGSTRVLDHDAFLRLYEDGSIDFPTISETEIQDRSKGDTLAKGFVILQTTWFIFQCIARTALSLGISELEIMTLAFATLNGAMYFFWWNKPLDVRIPVRILVKGKMQASSKIVDLIPKRNLWRTLVEIPTETACSLLHMLGLRKSPSDGSRVPTFDAPDVKRREHQYAIIGVTFTGIVFGAIHCIAWNFHFPSHLESLLWKVSAAYITISPIIIALGESIHYLPPSLKHPMKPRDGYVQVAFILVEVAALPVYMISRFALFVLAFTTLRDLSPAVAQGIQWTSYIPHI